MSGVVELESAAGTVAVANVKSVMMARRRALQAVTVGSTQTKMFSSLRSVVVVGFKFMVLCACCEGEDMILYYGAPPRARGGAREYERAVVQRGEPRAPRVVCRYE